MGARLCLRFVPEPDGTGCLSVDVAARGFAGTSSAWFAEETLLAFGRSLETTFPLSATTPLQLQGGFGGEGHSAVGQLHVGLAFHPIGFTGQVGCRVRLATPVYAHDRPEQASTVAVELVTAYQALRNFGAGLQALALGDVRELVLECET